MDTDLLDIDTAIEESFSEPEPETDEKDVGKDEKDTVDAESEEKGESEKKSKDEPEKDGEGKKKDEEETGDDPAKEKPKPKRGDKRIDQLLHERSKLRRENEELRSQIKTKGPELPMQPDPKDYKDQREYDFAMGGWQKEVESAKAESGKQKERQIAQEADRYQARIRTEKVKYSDFDTVVSDISDIPITPELHDALGEEGSVDLLYFLGRNPAIAENVLSLKSHSQSRKLAEISMKVKSAAGKKKKVVSSAPKPPAKVGGGGASAKKDPGKMSPEEWAKYAGYKT